MQAFYKAIGMMRCPLMHNNIRLFCVHVLQTKAVRDWQLQLHYQTLHLHWQIIRLCPRHSKLTRVSYKLLHQSWSPFTIKQLMSWSTGLLSNQLSTNSPLHYLIMCLDILLTLKFHWYLQQFIEWKYAEIKKAMLHSWLAN